MKFIKLFENFESGYTLGDVLLDAYEINYVLDEQNITAYYSFAIYSDWNANLSTYQIGTTDPEDSDVFIKKLSSENYGSISLKKLSEKEFGIGDMITISFFDNNVNKYHQVTDEHGDVRYRSYLKLLKEHLEPFNGLSIYMKPYKLYPASAPVLTIIIKR